MYRSKSAGMQGYGRGGWAILTGARVILNGLVSLVDVPVRFLAGPGALHQWLLVCKKLLMRVSIPFLAGPGALPFLLQTTENETVIV